MKSAPTPFNVFSVTSRLELLKCVRAIATRF